MRRTTVYAAAIATAALPAVAGTDFGTPAQARQMAENMVRIIDRNGIEAGLRALHNVDHPVNHRETQFNLFQGSILVGDNREPEMVAADYSETSDMTGRMVWPRIVAAADAKSDAELKWYHYDTQEAYDYHCYSLRASRDDGLVMVCP